MKKKDGGAFYAAVFSICGLQHIRQYLNKVVEQDHRRVQGRLRPMLGFKAFYNARRVIIGIELAQKIHKRQFAIPIPWRSNPAVIGRHVMAA